MNLHTVPLVMCRPNFSFQEISMPLKGSQLFLTFKQVQQLTTPTSLSNSAAFLLSGLAKVAAGSSSPVPTCAGLGGGSQIFI